MNIHRRRSLVALVATIVVLATMAFAVSPASATNYCGTRYAGKFYNAHNTRASVLVTGDTANGRTISAWVSSGRTAASYGICDADFWRTYVPVLVGGTGYPAYSTFKIGWGTDSCWPSGRSDYVMRCYS